MKTDGPHWQVSAASTPLRRAPRNDAPLETELLHGESFQVKEEQGRWVRGVCLHDDYPGWAEKSAFSSDAFEPTHLVRVLRTYRYSEPDLKSVPLNLISMNARVHLEQNVSGRFRQDARGGWLVADHVGPVGEKQPDFVAVAEHFLGAPYYWGGRTSLGLDCSALVQNALFQAGLKVPRDSGPQQQHFLQQNPRVLFEAGKTDRGWHTISFARGDLVFWRGHVAIMVDSTQLVHANATHMAVTINPLKDFAEKIFASDGDVSAIIRPQIDN